MRKNRIAIWALASIIATMVAPNGGSAQEWPEGLPPPPLRSALVRDGDAWRFPTPLDALRVLREPPRPGRWRPESDPVVAVLAQRFETRSRTELNALADALAALVLDESVDKDLRREATLALVFAANADKSYPDEAVVPYEGGFDALVRIYETMVSRIPDDGSDDPFYSLGRAFAGKTGDSLEYARYEQALSALLSVYQSEPDGRGRDYLLALIEASERPDPNTGGSTWCMASWFLYDEDRETLPDVDVYLRHCTLGSARSY